MFCFQMKEAGMRAAMLMMGSALLVAVPAQAEHVKYWEHPNRLWSVHMQTGENGVRPYCTLTTQGRTWHFVISYTNNEVILFLKNSLWNIPENTVGQVVLSIDHQFQHIVSVYRHTTEDAVFGTIEGGLSEDFLRAFYSGDRTQY